MGVQIFRKPYYGYTGSWYSAWRLIPQWTSLIPDDAEYNEGRAYPTDEEPTWGYLITALPISFTSPPYAFSAGAYALRRKESPEEYGPYGYSLQQINGFGQIAISFHIRNKSVWNAFQYRIIAIGI